MQMVQLHRVVPALGLKSASKRTAPHWQLPRYVRTPVEGEEAVVMVGLLERGRGAFGLAPVTRRS
ncbi:hypothetical protein D187_005436 [Cystobacter fuscus DSM 2262]|uniref:Uncharacterized protein n=1 Tax=Cystobacter fuscus (strain ATCC 25194 / DSM 2262 / NBRC 100088 / M29) TaxID=1242864 RepID=S9PP98_CYSF2|nr:hypothetical protein D187_005436 [Cystobacter fuscus DSM 2262]